MATKQVGGKGQNMTPPHAKTFNRSSPKLAGVIISWRAPGMQTFIAIGSGVSAPQIRDFAVPSMWLVCSFYRFFSKPTAYNPERISTQNI